MKKVIYLFLALAFYSKSVLAQSQISSTVWYSYVEIIQYSVNFTYSSNGTYNLYNPDYDHLTNVYAVAQARTDYNFNRISAEYHKLKNLELINKENKAILASHKPIILNQVQKDWKTADFGGTGVGSRNTAKLLEYITQLYRRDGIKKELELLQAINRELI